MAVVAVTLGAVLERVTRRDQLPSTNMSSK